MAKKPVSPPVFLRPPAFGAVPALDHLMAQAQALQHAGRAGEAERVYREVLRREPRHVDALHSLGMLAFQVGHPQIAADLIGQALAVDPHDAVVHGNLGYVLHVLGRHDEALQSLERALALRPGMLEALNNRGNTLSALGRHEEAIASFDRALSVRPDYVEAAYNRGNALHAAGRLVQALAAYDAVIAARADIAQAHNNRARVLQDLGRQDEALAAYERAVALAPTYAQAIAGRGTARLALKDAAAALADFDAALRIDPQHASAHEGRGGALFALRRWGDAVPAFTRCLEIAPTRLDARLQRGNALHELRRHEDAIADFDTVLAATPGVAGVACNRGNALLALKRYDEAALAFERVLALDTAYPYALGKRVHAQMMACDWRGLDALVAQVHAGVEHGRAVIEPFAYQAIAADPMWLRRCAELFAADQFPPQAALVAPGQRLGNARIRVGYLAGEFRNQATSILAVELFELHDRQRFEIVAFDNGWDDGSTVRRRMNSAFDEVVSIAALPDDEAARAVADRRIDILVNLNGWFGLGRTGVFARRPAPVQVNYLGFPGTLGAPYLDVIVADAQTIPAGEEGAYVERVVRLPHSYQPNDRQRAIGAPTTRAEQGLPDDAVVFACFNNTYKITPETFASWMRILAAVDGSVLWLLQDNDAATRNLREAASSHGIAAGRLHFAPRIRLDDHLARHACADLFLDTLPYNAHTTASDALWAGLPVLSCRGTSFPGRVGASLLHALGVADELLVDDVAAFESRAIELARDQARLAHVRERLARARTTAPLFDTPACCAALERAYEAMLVG
ncbi:tetratricopeptide repeat protein [Scleromatobacter humisilvae]|uniref:protein O-GlcNAc transferase n=1 Tax=Scleromatobacter humisilvae TaxID=2897159 RepID=A0A9X1YLM6_9BURK|nr:tetratricopeptide repeat protein [Scleromatobacter humisilvae]MCK9688226.1 tetratricopeptide repeat protein [Scleromatobacter humisilvae]